MDSWLQRVSSSVGAVIYMMSEIRAYVKGMTTCFTYVKCTVNVCIH